MQTEVDRPVGLLKLTPLPPLAVIPLEFSPKHEGKQIACLGNFNYDHEVENPLTDKEILESEKINNNVDNIVEAASKMKKRRCQRVLRVSSKPPIIIKNASEQVGGTNEFISNLRKGRERSISHLQTSMSRSFC